MRLIIYIKDEKIPGLGDVVTSYDHVLEDSPVTGGCKMGLFIYDCRYKNQKFSKIYIDKMNKRLLGKRNEISTWTELALIDSVETVIL